MCVCWAGVKIVGGYRELTGEEFGIYIKRVVCGGLAALDGTAGDQSISLTDGRTDSDRLLSPDCFCLCPRSA